MSQNRASQHIPASNGVKGRSMSIKRYFGFALDLESDDWIIENIRASMECGSKVTHVDMVFTGYAGKCKQCGCALKIHDRKNRSWRHCNIGRSVCYIHASIPRCQCPECRCIAQVQVPWATPNVSYTKMFREEALALLSEMSLKKVSDYLMISPDILYNISERNKK